MLMTPVSPIRQTTWMQIKGAVLVKKKQIGKVQECERRLAADSSVLPSPPCVSPLACALTIARLCRCTNIVHWILPCLSALWLQLEVHLEGIRAESWKEGDTLQWTPRSTRGHTALDSKEGDTLHWTPGSSSSPAMKAHQRST